MMRLSECLKRIERVLLSPRPIVESEVSDVAVDSRLVTPGTLFFAVVGERSDGHDFIDAARTAGAVAVVGTRTIESPDYVRVSDIHEALRVLSPLVYGEPQKDISFIGVTGTNGKTTTTHIIEQMLAPVGPVGLIGTIGYRWNGRTIAAENTTPFPWLWYRTLAAMKRDGVRFVVSEVSSHALDQDRIAGTLFDAAVFTNFTRDHLDYHKSDDAYFAAKRRLFTDYLKSGGTAVVNGDDPKGEDILRAVAKGNGTLRFSLSDPSADLWLREARTVGAGYELILSHRGSDLPVRFGLPGRFNLSNLLGAILAVSPFMSIADAAACADGIVVPGRMERVGSRGRIFVDYAHSPDALEKVLAAAKEFGPEGRLIVVFGAGGDRDRGKRPQMGAVAARWADIIIVTSDNPRTEDPYAIIADITGGITRREGVEVIPDRAAAIAHAVSLTGEDDVVVVAGKGAEDYQIIGTEKRHFSDHEQIRTALGETA